MLKMGDDLPLETASVDYDHTSGVLHHLPDPLRKLRWVLRSGGMARAMVYNYDLTVDEHGLPQHGDYRAGIDGCFVLRPRP